MGSSQLSPKPLEDGRRLEILHAAITLIAGRVGDGKIASTLGDLVRLLELETEVSARLATAPREVIYKWVEPSQFSEEAGDSVPVMQ